MILDRLKKTVKAIMGDDYPVDLDSVTRETRLIEDMGLNSISILMLVVGIEDEFGIEFPAQTKSYLTVGDVEDTIQQKLDEKK